MNTKSLQILIGLLSKKWKSYALGFLISVWTTRYLGPEGIGYINFAAAFVSLFAFFSTLGLDNITIRNIVNNPELKNEYLGSVPFAKGIRVNYNDTFDFDYHPFFPTR